MQADDALSLALALRLMGQGLFQHLTPDGYPDSGTAWINTGGLLARWNLALLAVNNRVPRTRVDLRGAMSNTSAKTLGDVVDFWTDRILHRAIPEADRQKLINATGASATSTFDPAKLPDLVALILASPHFQYR